MRIYLFLLIIILINIPTTNSIKGEISEGYILFAPMDSEITYLIDNTKEVVHEWQSTGDPFFAVYLDTDSSMYRLENNIIKQFDWAGNLVWFYSSSDLHHDFEIMPNGNILLIKSIVKTKNDCIEAGKENPPKFFTVDTIIEINKDGAIVWEWNSWDHIIQDYDDSLSNYGIISENPRKIDLNYNVFFPSELMHTNAIDYNPSKDQIVLSVNAFSEIWIIDHSISTQEAKGEKGDILYRWGNPESYGLDSDQEIFYVHDAQWLGNKILYFNNGFGRGYSSADELQLGSFTNGIFNGDIVWSYRCNWISLHISGVQRLSNGNTLICNGELGKIYEVTPQKEVVWSYTNPYGGLLNQLFKVRKYDPDYPGLKYINNKPPNTPSTPNGPLKGDIYDILSYSTTSSDIEGNSIYYQWTFGDETLAWIGPFNSSEIITKNYSWNSLGIKKVQVRAKDSLGALSPISNPIFVNISYNDNSPPKIPELPNGPANIKKNESYTYITKTSDSELHDVYYKWNWGNNVSTWIGPFETLENAPATNSWSSKGTFHIMVKAKDQFGLESDWSDYLIVNVENEPPINPEIIGNNTGKIGEIQSFLIKSSDPDGDNVGFFIDWGDNTSEWHWPENSSEFVVTHIWTIKGDYSIRVKAKDEYGAESDWSVIEINMPLFKNQFRLFLQKFIVRFPIIEKILFEFFKFK